MGDFFLGMLPEYRKTVLSFFKTSLVLVGLFLSTSSGWARVDSVDSNVYPWMNIGVDDIRYFESPNVDLALRVSLIKKAKHSIDIATYDQRADRQFSFPALEALREAANRGVKIRYIVSWFPQSLYDRSKIVPRYLLEPRTRTPIEYIIFGGPIMREKGWNLSDGVHEKIFIVDNKYLLASGRGYGEEYLSWLDTTFAIKGSLVLENADGFNKLWRSVRKQRRPYSLPEPSSYSERKYSLTDFKANPTVTALSTREDSKHKELLEWFDAPPRIEIEENGEIGRGRLLHFNFIDQATALHELPSAYDTDDRLVEFKDPIAETLIERLKTAKEVRLTAISTAQHPKLKQALIDARRNGADITIFTNGSESFGASVPNEAVWIVGLPDLDELMQAGIKVFTFNKNEKTPWIYLHRKLVIVDDAVIFGSHNFNVSSSTAMDEMSFEIESQSFAEKMKALFDGSLQENGKQVDRRKVHVENSNSNVARLFYRLFLGFM